MEETIARVKELLASREKLDAELAGIFGGQLAPRRAIKCGTCGEEGHSSRTCPSKPPSI